MSKLLLLGGGHAHALVLDALRKRKLDGVEVMLVTPSPLHTYSGMVPGLVAGHYQQPDLQIDLARLAREAGAVPLLDRAVGLSANEKTVHLEKAGDLQYDLLSLNLGSIITLRDPRAVSVKPFEDFIARWNTEGIRARSIAVIGGGAGGVELAMAMQFRRPEAGVVVFSDRPMFGGKLGKRIRSALDRLGVELREGTVVDKVGDEFDFVVQVTGAEPQPWLRETGLAVDEKGFVLVDASLRSVSHPEVFAAGDSATLRDFAHPKSGVYAVRHGACLMENLRRTQEGRTLGVYVPQASQLALISCGDRYAIASKGRWSIEGAWVWRWKDWVDRRWIGRFH